MKKTFIEFLVIVVFSIFFASAHYFHPEWDVLYAFCYGVMSGLLLSPYFRPTKRAADWRGAARCWGCGTTNNLHEIECPNNPANR